MKTPTKKWLTAALLVVPLAATAADPPAAKERPAQAQIKDALKAGPKSITDQAAVMSMDGKTLREGSNGWVCYPGPKPGGADSMCLDKVWQQWMQAYMSKAPTFKPSGVGLAYMLAGDGHGASNIDPWATGPTADNQWVVEGPHVMVLLPDPAQLEGLPTDAKSGTPYVMWKGTPYAHVMMPVGKRPAK